MFAPVSEALIADAEVTSGTSVLDVATGPGRFPAEVLIVSDRK